MQRKKRSTHVVELSLETSPSDERRLVGVFDAAKRLYNTLLQDGLLIVDALRADPAWAAARSLPRTTPAQREARAEAFRAARRAHSFSDYDFQSRATFHKNSAGFSDRLGSHVTQKLGTRLFKALEEHLFGLRGRPRFKSTKRPLHSIEGKNDAAAPRWDVKTGSVQLSRNWAVPVKPPRLGSDEWLWSALQGEVKYTRVLWRMADGHRKYYLQMVLDGPVPMKASLASRLMEVPRASEGGIDIGPSRIAWCTTSDAGEFQFCAEVDAPERRIIQLQRQLDRQRRANNPGNFDAHGRAKKGSRSWVRSKGQAKTEIRLRSAQTHAAQCRKNAHGRDINQLQEHAMHWRHDGVSIKSLQRNYGRSVSKRAPGRFMSELKRKAESAGGSSSSVNVRQLKTSQFDHSTGNYAKKRLSQRWHVFGDSRGQVQRDVYSAFLALHAVETVDADGVVTWSHDPKRLEAAWVALEPALRARELFHPIEGASTDGPQGTGASIAPCRGPCQPPSSDVSDSVLAPGIRTRGAAREKRSSTDQSEPARPALVCGPNRRPGI